MRTYGKLAFVIALSIVLASCAGTTAPDDGPSGVVTDLDGLQINVGVENAYPPFNYIDEATNEAMGWDYDAVRAICDVINCVPVFVEAAWDGIFEAIAAGEYDMVADGVTITAERDEIVAALELTWKC